jgi:hypothetical protein
MAVAAFPTSYEFREPDDFDAGAADTDRGTVIRVEWAGGDRWVVLQGRWHPPHLWDHTQSCWTRPPAEPDDEDLQRYQSDLRTALEVGAALADDGDESGG